MKTNSLRKLIKTQLATLPISVYYLNANNNAMYPHVVFSLTSVNTGDLSRSDYVLDIDLWFKGASSFDIEEMADEIEALLKMKNLPTSEILPTFIADSRKTVIDEDKNIKHILLSFTVQLYEK